MKRHSLLLAFMAVLGCRRDDKLNCGSHIRINGSPAQMDTQVRTKEKWPFDSESAVMHYREFCLKRFPWCSLLSSPQLLFIQLTPVTSRPATVRSSPLHQWYSNFFPPVPLETLLHSTLYPQSCWCKISFLSRVRNARNRKQYKFALERNVIL
jgi:hypothetical protein